MKNVVFWDVSPCGSEEHIASIFRVKAIQLYLTGNTLRLSYRVQPVNAMLDLRFSRRWL
jgi:hypothetical protein